MLPHCPHDHGGVEGLARAHHAARGMDEGLHGARRKVRVAARAIPGEIDAEVIEVDPGGKLGVAEPWLEFEIGPAATLATEERELVKRLLEFPAVVEQATERRAPHAIPIYAIRVADDFHRFYHEHRVLESENEGFRLGLCAATQAVVARSLDLVGVAAPERM